MPVVAGSRQPDKDWYQYEQRVARQGGLLGDYARATGPVDADGIEPALCCFVDAKYTADPSTTQFRADGPPWIVPFLRQEFESYRNAVVASNSTPKAQPRGLIVRTNEASTHSFFEGILRQAGFTIGLDGFVQIVQ